MYNSHFRFFAGKLLSKWEGPYTIEEVYRSGAIKINNFEGTNPKVVNGQRIKHYISGTPINVESNIIQTLTLDDRGKGVPSFDEMMDIALVAVDFDDPTTNVRGRRALAIAKPTPRGY